jgi:citrate synthase
VRYRGTDIDGPGLDPERLGVRGHDLNELIGRHSYTGAAYLVLTGVAPSPDAEQRLDAHLADTLRALRPDSPAARLARGAAESGASYSRAVMAGLMADVPRGTGAERLAGLPFDEEERAGLHCWAIIPGLVAQALAPTHLDAPGRTGAADYLEAIYGLATGRRFGDAAARQAFTDVMVSFQAGFGAFTPTVMLPRIASGTGVPVAQAIAAGFAGAGPFHTGACEVAMEVFGQIAAAGGPVAGTADATLERLLGKGIVPGFGHPLFRKDPRVDRLRGRVAELGLRSPALEVFDRFAARLRQERDINPNIDGISAAVFLTLGIAPRFGSALFMCSRTVAMIAHVVERRRTKPAFGVRSEKAREGLESVPVEWL